MPRRSKYEREKEKDPELDISSLIDVSFLLLIYFLVTSTLRKDEVDLSIVLPTQTPTENPDPIDPVAISVLADGSVNYDGQQISGPRSSGARPDQLPELRTRLKEYKELADSTGNQAVVIVAADDSGKHQRFIDVINALASVKIKNVTMTGFRDEE